MSPRRGGAANEPTLGSWIWIAPLGAWLATAASCAGADTEATASSRSRVVEASELAVDISRPYQRITGFGASSAWTGGSISDAMADQFFSAERGLGLSLLRLHIKPDGGTDELVTAKRAAARGVAVWAAPWSPPGEWKTSGTDNQGGSLLPEHYQDWADRLAAFAVTMHDAGVPLVALSAQNEPNWTAEWETCVYTPDELVTFIGEYLAPTLARESPDTKLLGPETIDWTTLQSFADPLLADPAVSDALDIVAVHAYGGTPFPYSAPAEHGKELWETEVSYDDATGQLAALQTARHIQRHLTDGGVNAFHYWWLTSTTSGALMTGGKLLPQAYALGHYSKFVRPGYVRVDVPAKPRAGISSSAFYDPESHRTVLVLVNETADDVTYDLRIEGAAPIEVRPWVTSESQSLEAQPALDFADPFPYPFGAQTVTSLVFSETVEPVDVGSGGAPPSVAGAPSIDEGGEPSSGGGEPTSLPGPRGDETGSGGEGTAAGSSSATGGSDPSRPSGKRGGYMACTTSAPSSTGSPLLLSGLALFAVSRRRRSVRGRR